MYEQDWRQPRDSSGASHYVEALQPVMAPEWTAAPKAEVYLATSGPTVYPGVEHDPAGSSNEVDYLRHRLEARDWEVRELAQLARALKKRNKLLEGGEDKGTLDKAEAATLGDAAVQLARMCECLAKRDGQLHDMRVAYDALDRRNVWLERRNAELEDATAVPPAELRAALVASAADPVMVDEEAGDEAADTTPWTPLLLPRTPDGTPPRGGHCGSAQHVGASPLVPWLFAHTGMGHVPWAQAPAVVTGPAPYISGATTPAYPSPLPPTPRQAPRSGIVAHGHASRLTPRVVPPRAALVGFGDMALASAMPVSRTAQATPLLSARGRRAPSPFDGAGCGGAGGAGAGAGAGAAPHASGSVTPSRFRAVSPPTAVHFGPRPVRWTMRRSASPGIPSAALVARAPSVGGGRYM